MRTFFLFFIAVSLLTACRDDEPAYPVYEIASGQFWELGNNEIDDNRLCLAQTLALMLGEQSFREYLREKSINAGENWNEEFVIIRHLDELVYDGFTFLEVVQQTIESSENTCLTSSEDFRQRLLSDPVLVLKVPDLIPAEEWDAVQTVPFLYTKTVDFVTYPTEDPQIGMLGLHPSGAVDPYQFDVPKYFPVVLKFSEDYVAVNDQLELLDGTLLSAYHFDIAPSVYGADYFDTLEHIADTEWRLVRLNDLMAFINTSRSEIFEPNPIVSCSEDCNNDCISQEDRRLLLTEVGFRTQNEAALEYQYSVEIRPEGQLILSENVLPLVICRQLSNENFYDWQRYLTGSFRLNALFEVGQSHEVKYNTFSVDGQAVELPEFTADYQVMGLNQQPVPNLLLAEDIEEGDLFRFASHRIKLDLPTQPEIAIDDNPISAYDNRRDIVQNFSLYCISEEVFGFNAMALWVKI